MVDTPDTDEPLAYTDMPRGIFTTEDRKYLSLDRDDWAEQEDIRNPVQAAYERRKAISKRLLASIWDFSTALYSLEHDTRKKTFEGAFYNHAKWVSFQRVTNSIGFLLLGLMEQQNKRLDDEEFLKEVLEQSLDRMLWGSEQRIGINTGNIDVKVTIEGWQRQDDYEDHLDLADLTDNDLEWKFRMGDLSREEYAQEVMRRENED